MNMTVSFAPVCNKYTQAANKRGKDANELPFQVPLILQRLSQWMLCKHCLAASTQCAFKPGDEQTLVIGGAPNPEVTWFCARS